MPIHSIAGLIDISECQEGTIFTITRRKLVLLRHATGCIGFTPKYGESFR